MKKLNKVLVLVLSAIMVLAMSASVFAADPADGKITVTPPAGTQSDSTNTYTLYKVFAATTNGSSYSYKLSGNHTTVPEGFILDDAGNIYFADVVEEEGTGTFKVKVNGVDTILKNKTALTQTDIDNIAAYVTEGDIVGDPIEVTGTTPAVFNNLEYGYYFVTTTTGTLVVIDSTKPDVEVTDKNTVPQLDKKATGETVMDEAGKKAIAQVGTIVEFEATITVGKGAENYVFHDVMSAGLALDSDSISVTASPAVTGEEAWYTIKETPDEGDTLTITFKNGIAENTKITIKYSAIVTSDALQVDEANNTATVSYGDENGSNSTPPSTVEVYNAKIIVDKKDGSGNALAGAGFVLMNAAGEYYKFTPASGTNPPIVSWVEEEADATELITVIENNVAKVEFTGLGAGTYTLHEKTVPEGYNAAADVTITVGKSDAEANLVQTAAVVNNSGAELPGTGGIGTTIFYILGSLLVVGCGIVLVSRKRMQK